jgi:hypothetical protein
VRPQQRRGRHRRERRAEVGEVEVGGVGHARGGPEGGFGGHLAGDERRAAERTGALVVLHPAVQAPPVEEVAAVREPPHLVAAADAAEAHRAVPLVGNLRRGAELVEAHHGEHLLDDHRRHRAELRPAVLQQQHLLRRRPSLRRVVVVPEIQQVAEADGVERPEEEAADVAEQEEEVEQLLREHHLRVSTRESHAYAWVDCVSMPCLASLRRLWYGMENGGVRYGDAWTGRERGEGNGAGYIALRSWREDAGTRVGPHCVEWCGGLLRLRAGWCRPSCDAVVRRIPAGFKNTVDFFN